MITEQTAMRYICPKSSEFEWVLAPGMAALMFGVYALYIAKKR